MESNTKLYSHFDLEFDTWKRKGKKSSFEWVPKETTRVPFKSDSIRATLDKNAGDDWGRGALRRIEPNVIETSGKSWVTVPAQILSRLLVGVEQDDCVSGNTIEILLAKNNARVG